MATIQSKVDDLDPEQVAAGTAFLSLNDRFIEIDLSNDNFKELEETLAVYFKAGRTAEMPRGGRRTPAYMITNGDVVGVGSKSSDDAAAASPEVEPTPAEIRTWAEANNIPVSERGRIAEDITAQYKAAKAAEAAAAAEAEKPDDAKK